MTDNRARNGTLGAILGALIAVAFAVFLLNGGECGQKDGQKRRRSSTGRNRATALTESSSPSIGGRGTPLQDKLCDLASRIASRKITVRRGYPRQLKNL